MKERVWITTPICEFEGGSIWRICSNLGKKNILRAQKRARMGSSMIRRRLIVKLPGSRVRMDFVSINILEFLSTPLRWWRGIIHVICRLFGTESFDESWRRAEERHHIFAVPIWVLHKYKQLRHVIDYEKNIGRPFTFGQSAFYVLHLLKKCAHRWRAYRDLLSYISPAWNFSVDVLPADLHQGSELHPSSAMCWSVDPFPLRNCTIHLYSPRS